MKKPSQSIEITPLQSHKQSKAERQASGQHTGKEYNQGPDETLPPAIDINLLKNYSQFFIGLS